MHAFESTLRLMVGGKLERGSSSRLFFLGRSTSYFLAIVCFALEFHEISYQVAIFRQLSLIHR